MNSFISEVCSFVPRPLPELDPVKDYRARLITERNQLQKKLDKLVQFLGSADFKTLLPPASDLLVEQRAIMAAYLNVLNSRIYVAPPTSAADVGPATVPGAPAVG
jgi:hypothetical protein